jgi:hypothetical protein
VLVLAVVLAIVLISAEGAESGAAQHSAGVCPMMIRVQANGKYVTNRFHGWYSTSSSLLANDLKGGCYNDGELSPVTSITLQIAPGAPQESLTTLYLLLEGQGWNKARLNFEPWQQVGHP